MGSISTTLITRATSKLSFFITPINTITTATTSANTAVTSITLSATPVWPTYSSGRVSTTRHINRRSVIKADGTGNIHIQGINFLIGRISIWHCYFATIDQNHIAKNINTIRAINCQRYAINNQVSPHFKLFNHNA